jgi:hypothetical protein
MSHPRKSLSTVAAMLAIAIVGVLLVAPGATSATTASSSRTAQTQATQFQNVPVTGTTGAGTFRGTMQITRFAASGGNLQAVGQISGAAKNSSGAVVKTVLNAPAQIPLVDASATCTILHLVLGPLDLDLLGLHVHLNRVVLDITAHQGPGQLLGNLLCALAHLLDGGQASVLSQLLTAVLRIVAAVGAMT